MSPPLLVLDGAPPSELKSGIVNSTRIRFRCQVLPSETKLRGRSGVSPILRIFFDAFSRPEMKSTGECRLEIFGRTAMREHRWIDRATVFLRSRVRRCDTALQSKCRGLAVKS
jgi:hypothetical protein